MGYQSKIRAFLRPVALSNGYSAQVGLFDKRGIDACSAALMGGTKSSGQLVVEGQGAAQAARTIVDQSMDNSAYTTARLVHGIKEWTLDDDAGAILPINETTVQILSGPDMAACLKAIEEVNAGPESAEKSPSDG